MIKRFLKKTQGQALSETAIFLAFAGMLIMIFLVNIGFIQVVRLRLSMANRFMVYTAAHANNPNRGRRLEDKVRLMLGNGPPVISAEKKYFNNLQLSCYERSVSIGNFKLPCGFKNVEGRISVDYYYNSSVMRKLTGNSKMVLSSGKIVMYKDSLYKGISLNIKKFLGFK